MTYKERLLATNEELKADMAETRAEEAEARLDARIASAKADVVSLRNQRDSLLNGYPLNVEAIKKANSQVRRGQEEVDDLVSIKAELFGGEEG